LLTSKVVRRTIEQTNPRILFEEHKKLLKQITSDLEINTQDDLYSLSTNVCQPSFVAMTNFQQLHEKGGAELLKHYKNTQELLSTLYPELEWLPWKFPKCPHNFWDDVNNQRKFVDWAGKQLDIKEMSDWYQVIQKVTRYL
jgi:hypothetical protein